MGDSGDLWVNTSLVLIRKFQVDWLKVMLLGQAETTIKSGIILKALSDWIC